MANLPLISDEDATPEQKAIFDGSRALLGRVPIQRVWRPLR